MEIFISRVLKNIEQHLNSNWQQLDLNIDHKFYNIFIIILAVNFLGLYLFPWEIFKNPAILEKFMAISYFTLLTSACGFPLLIDFIKKLKTNKIKDIINDEKQNLCELVLDEQEALASLETLEDIQMVAGNSEKSQLASVAYIDPSTLSLNQLKEIMIYVHTVIDDCEKGELQEEPFKEGYKPRKRLFRKKKLIGYKI